jgi:NADPH-dependent curcumin reductase CurA
MPSVQSWIYKKTPKEDGSDITDSYEKETSELGSSGALTLGPRDVLIHSSHWSVDPYVRIQQAKKDTWSTPHPLGVTQGGDLVGTIVEVGSALEGQDLVGRWAQHYGGWTTHHVAPLSAVRLIPQELEHLAPHFLGTLGMPGRTAYFSMLAKGAPTPGDVVLVSGAAGAVGHLAVQLAVAAGATVIGVAGSDEKCAWLRKIGCAETINYRTAGTTLADVSTVLGAAAPTGIDVYLDNTGGLITDAAIPLMRTHGRVVIVGQISQYNGGLDEPEAAPRFLHHLIYRRVSILGFLARDWAHRQPEVVERLSALLTEGKVDSPLTVVEGFDTLPSTFASYFQGSKHRGKLLVRNTDHPAVPEK